MASFFLARHSGDAVMEMRHEHVLEAVVALAAVFIDVRV